MTSTPDRELVGQTQTLQPVVPPVGSTAPGPPYQGTSNLVVTASGHAYHTSQPPHASIPHPHQHMPPQPTQQQQSQAPQQVPQQKQGTPQPQPQAQQSLSQPQQHIVPTQQS